MTPLPPALRPLTPIKLVCVKVLQSWDSGAQRTLWHRHVSLN